MFLQTLIARGGGLFALGWLGDGVRRAERSSETVAA